MPPEGVTDAVPLHPPKQLVAEDEVLSEGPPVLFTLAVLFPVHPLASVTVIAYEPASRPVAVAVVWFPAAAFH